ncbi:uncharacterized protein LOC129775389 [Toxorhynchites rutilus septentrionalis]|uniref:uncharacterized protein LOC129775389 n=1 Tax=Toxorhynchites rutilus septentrionalis TaxID=329112 RepID=UPI002479EE64|nr:uncharacterized protein LOC129775389 [Toxorhynchites rutilus septentrionalis]
MKGYLFLIVASILTAYPLRATAVSDDEIIDPSWEKPDAWSQYERQQRLQLAAKAEECNCPPIVKCEPVKPCPVQPKAELSPTDENNRLGAVFYKKFVTRLFARNQLENDKESGFLLRNVQFKITPLQMNQLTQASSAHEIDGIVSSIMEQSHHGIYQTTAENVFWGLRAMYSSIRNSVFFFFLFVPTVGLLTGFFVVKIMSRVMHVHPLLVVFLMFIGVSYAISLNDCNQKLEMESLAKMMNPCQQRHASGGGFLGWMQRFFGEDTEAKCREHLRETMGASTRTCDPSEVFVEMVAKLHLKYLETFVYKMISIFNEASATSGMFGKILIGLFLLVLVYILITHGLKYGIYGFSSFLATYITAPGRTPAVGLGGQQAYAALPVGEQQQLSASTSQPPSVNFHINVGRKSKKFPRLEPSRIEDIANGNDQPMAALKITGEGAPKKVENGSGDGQKEQTDSEHTSELESGDETVEFKCKIATIGGPPIESHL